MKDLLSGWRRVLIAFSGGVDSTLLAALACDVLGSANVLAVTADSPSLALADLEEAKQLAHWLGVEQVVVRTGELSNPAYRANTSSRCFLCKQELFACLQELARQRRISTILYGAIGDDLLDERPGAVAAAQAGVRAPLQEAGLSKADVRTLARERGLPNWNRPQNACLSSRIPRGQEVTTEKLAQVERAEAFLRQLGFRQVRVRCLDAPVGAPAGAGSHARIEVGPEQVSRFQDAALCRQVAEAVAALGFVSVGVDRGGYRAGGVNRAGGRDEQLLVVDGGVAQSVRAGES